MDLVRLRRQSSYFVTMGTLKTNVASMAILPDRDIGVVVLGDGYDSVAGNSAVL